MIRSRLTNYAANMRASGNNDADYLYYNIDISNKTNVNTLAKFDETRVIPLLKHPDEYEMSIVRFSVPTSNIPLLIWPGDDVYTITIEWQGTSITQFLQWGGQGFDLYGPAIYSYQEICDIVNTAMNGIYTSFGITFPGPLPAPDWNLFSLQAPRMIFNPETRRFSLQFPYETPDYNNPSVGPVVNGHWSSKDPPSPPENEIKVFFNRASNNLVRGFQWIVDETNDDKFFRIVVGDNFNNILNPDPTDPLSQLYNMEQLFVNLQSINQLSNIIFRTSKIPVVSEYSSGQRNITQQILTDFELSDDSDFNVSVNYFPQGPLRYYPMTSLSSDFRDIDVQVFWKNRNGNEFPLYISPGKNLTIKMQFRKVPSIVFDEVVQGQYGDA